MNVTQQFVKEIPSSEGTIFEFQGGVVTGGVGVILENLSDVNSLVYRFQQSYDRVTWVDVEFTSSEGDPVSQFSIPPSTGRHHFKVTYSRPYLRLFASGNLTANIQLTHTKASALASGTPILITP